MRSKQIDMRKREDILALLSPIHSEPGAVMLLFAGSSVVELEIGNALFLPGFRPVLAHPGAGRGIPKARGRLAAQPSQTRRSAYCSRGLAHSRRANRPPGPLA